MKVHHTKYKPRYEAYILDHIDVDYETSHDHQRAKINFNKANREKKIDIEQMGTRPA